MERDKELERYFDEILIEALTDYMDEESNAWESELSSLPEPAYSLKYKRFINKLLGKTVHPVSNWKKWTCIAAAFLGVCVFISYDSIASYREIYKNKVIKETDVSFNIKLKPMYVEYDLSNIPDEWEYVYLPNDIMQGFEVEEMSMQSDKIEVQYSNVKGQTVKYALYNEKLDYSKSGLEQIEIKNMNHSYITNENGSALIMETEQEGIFYTIVIESDTIEMEDMIWMAKNLKRVKGGEETTYYED